MPTLQQTGGNAQDAMASLEMARVDQGTKKLWKLDGGLEILVPFKIKHNSAASDHAQLRWWRCRAEAETKGMI